MGCGCGDVEKEIDDKGEEIDAKDVLQESKT